MIALLHGHIFSRSAEGLQSFGGGKMFFESLKYWVDQYTIEISHRDYAWWNEPHAAYIKFEYGFIERNWQKLVDGIEIK